MITIEQIKEKALEEHIPIIMDDTLEYIEKILLSNKPVNILEIGTATGYSSICFSNILNNTVNIDTIEFDEVRAKEAIENINNLKLKNINVMIGNAVDILPTLNKEYDLVFIDAAKGKYSFFLQQAIRLSHKNSIILADNILYKGYVMSDYNKHKQRTAVRNLREYIAEATNNEKLQTEIIEIGDGLAISILK